jgi:hypothetical protein
MQPKIPNSSSKLALQIISLEGNLTALQAIHPKEVNKVKELSQFSTNIG